MHRRLLFVALLLVTQTGIFAQEGIELDLVNPNLKSLDVQTFHAVNELRIQKNRELLEWDEVLYRAAKDQADYLIKEKKLTHNQRTTEKQSPLKRVKLHSGFSYKTIGENLVSVQLGVVIRFKSVKLSTQSYNTAANTMAQLWKASPKHYHNILNKVFNTTAVATAYDPKSQRLVAVQVFGFTRQPATTIEQPDLSDLLVALPQRKLPYRLKEPKSSTISHKRAAKAFMRLSSVNGILTGSYKTGKRAFKGRRSGIAVEFIPITQFDSGACDYNLVRNRRNGLFLLNGELGKPVYRREMLRFSRQHSPRRVILNLRVLKIYKRDKRFFFPVDAAIGSNVFLIHNKRLITYTTPSAVPAKLLVEPMPLLKFENSFTNKIIAPQFKKISKYDTVAAKVFYDSKSVTIDSLTSQNIVHAVGAIRGKIVHVTATAYASIDGEMSQNHELARKRAAGFMAVVKPYLDSISVAPEVSSKEQWSLFLEQIKKNNLSHLAGLHKRELRNYVNTHKSDSLISSLLSQQRFALFKMVVRHDSLIPLPVENAVATYYRQKQKFEFSKSKSTSQAALLEQAQLRAYGHIISKKALDTIAIANYEQYPSFRYHDLLFRYLARHSLSDQEFYEQLHVLGQSKYLSGTLRKQLVYNNLVFIYNKYRNEGTIWETLDRDMLYCKGYRKTEFLVQSRKSLNCWRDEHDYYNDYYMLKEFPYVMSRRLQYSPLFSDSLSRFYTTSMINALYFPVLPKEIFTHLGRIKALYHPDDNALSLQERVRLAFFYCAFWKFDVAKSLLAPVADNPGLDSEGQKLFITLRANDFSDQHEYAEYLIKQYRRLGAVEWCSIWKEKKYLTYLMLEDQKLRQFYNCNCQTSQE